MATRKDLLTPDAKAFLQMDAAASPAPLAEVAPPSPAAEARVRFTVDLPEPLHHRLKLAALEQRTHMTGLARQALEEWLDSRG
jgi:hypothetical protein